MKNHVSESRDFDHPCDESLDSFIDRFNRAAEGLVDPVIDTKYWYEGDDLRVKGWRPMTEKEIAQAEARRKAAKHAAATKKAKQEAKERKLLEKLQKKYGGTT